MRCVEGIVCLRLRICLMKMRILWLVPLFGLAMANTLYFRPYGKSTELTSPVICPDQQSECPAGSTCCLETSGQYGCCPLPKALCCPDGKRCCPEGSKCDTASTACLKGTISFPSLLKNSAAKTKTYVECPDHQSQCEKNQTCCLLKNGYYGCCPLQNAVCCPDKKGCCAEGTKCKGDKCIRDGKIVMDQVEKLSAVWKVKDLITHITNVICPDGETECKTGQTCCKLAGGGYGCCPIPKAVCCSDHKHCCPEGTACDPSSEKCNRGGNLAMDWFEKVPAQKRDNKAKDVLCPDDQSKCRDGETCCKLASGAFGCCPHANTYVECPDHQSQCEKNQTCCLLKNGYYGCCPLQNAVCCPDKKGCCAEGTTCKGDKCIRDGKIVMDQVGKLSAVWKVKDVITRITNIKCPDGETECKDSQTCCKLAGGGYGCCPLPKAVCCSDHIHCCPEGTACEPSSGKCNRGGNLVMDWFEKVPAQKRDNKAKDVLCPDDQSKCRDGETCCKLASGAFGCCPHANAVCCQDKKHCCPNDYSCDVSKGICNKKMSFSVNMRKLRIAKKMPHPPPHSVMCPDGESECMDGQTCCLLVDQTYGCCPIEDAQCCSDHVHCCPQGTTCDLVDKKCIDTSKKFGMTIMEMFVTQPARKVRVKDVLCPDKASQCPIGQTCCPLSNGHYGCCPQLNAVCCSDGKHCCPAKTQCIVAKQMCQGKNNITTDWLEKLPAQKLEQKVVPAQKPEQNVVLAQKPEQNVVLAQKPEQKVVQSESVVMCPGGKYQCEVEQTCCKVDADTWSCCPLPKVRKCDSADCCTPLRGPTDSRPQFLPFPVINSDDPDHFMSFESLLGKATTEQDMPSAKKTFLARAAEEQQADCCGDMMHCCPVDTQCVTTTGKCVKGDSVIMDWFVKVPAKPVPTKAAEIADVANVVCPDKKSECKEGQTCCKTSAGDYGCCPLKQAVCCADMKHCCPNGYTCKAGTGKCEKGDTLVMDWFMKLPIQKTSTLKVAEQNVICPDGQSACPTGQTCCKLASGEYGCCPLPNAVCCSDHEHCCPHGYTCTGTQCQQGNKIINWLEKLPAKKIPTEAVAFVQNVVCPDGQSECHDGQTCCILASGGYGCCPKPNAVCCSDHEHCCPHGYTCTGTQCQQGNKIINWLEKLPAKKIPTEAVAFVQNVVCPDGQSECHDGQTCCILASGGYGCCPKPNAVCCSDHKHCCPQGYTCDPSDGKCMKGSYTINWIDKLPSTKLTSDVAVTVQNVICPDGQSECHDGQTCCKLASGNYGCCPEPNAVCCSDHKHCCPQGYTCDPSDGKCTKGSYTINWIDKLPSTKLTSDVAVTVQNVICPDGQSECRDGQTCCKLASGNYGCCPIPNAVCCDDHVHCCPKDYTCDVSSGTCSKGDNLVMEWLQKVPAIVRNKKNGTIPCPDKTMCPEDQACCQFGNSLGCCFYKNGVCCNQGGVNFCCPPDYICDEGAYICRQPEGKKQFKNTANLFIQKILKDKRKV